MNKYEELSGGREGAIYKNANAVHRPWNLWSPTVHTFLKHLGNQGITFCPEFLGRDPKGNEILSYIDGDVYNYPLHGAISDALVLQQAARMLRRIHDSSKSFLSVNNASELEWMLTPREPAEVICHGDYAPYNIVLQGNTVAGIIDFDTIHPGPRIWDIAYAVYTWAPFKTGEYDKMGTLEEQISRARMFCDAYGMAADQRRLLADTIIARLEAVLTYMHSEAEKGNEAFIANIRDGHHLGYQNDIEYVKEHHIKITQGVIS